MGINAPIPMSGEVSPLPREEESEQTQLAPELEVLLGMGNYKSLQDDAEGAQQEFDRFAQRGFATFLAKEEAQAHFPSAVPVHLALLTRVMEAGVKICHIIVDFFRSGSGELRRVVGSRENNPAPHRALQGSRRRQEVAEEWRIELMLLELADPCMHFAVHPDELHHCLAPTGEGQPLVLLHALNPGFRAAPLILGRLVAAAMRLFQAMMPEDQGQIQCYMEVLMMVQGPE